MIYLLRLCGLWGEPFWAGATEINYPSTGTIYFFYMNFVVMYQWLFKKLMLFVNAKQNYSKIKSKKLMNCRRRKLLFCIFCTAKAEEVEAVIHHRCSSKLVFLKVSQISQENSCVGVSPSKVLSCEFCKIFENIFFTVHFGWLLL